MRIAVGGLVFLWGACWNTGACGDMFGSGANMFDIEFSLISPPGNAADTTAAWTSSVGNVPYEYRMSRFEISEDMVDKANAAGGLGISHDNRGANMPATSITWIEAAKFVNWLNTSTGRSAAYNIDASGILHNWTPTDPGYDATNLYRNKNARYVLPSADEWHKAAYYDPQGLRWWDYPHGNDSPPDGLDSAVDASYEAVFRDGLNNIAGPQPVNQAGVASQYAVEGLGGNVWEWEETDFDLTNDNNMNDHGIRGGWFNGGTIYLSAISRTPYNRQSAAANLGIRVVSTFATPMPPGDLDGDGKVDPRDFMIWQRASSISEDDLRDWQKNFGAGTDGNATAVPEPATALLLLSAIAAVAAAGNVSQEARAKAVGPRECDA